MSFEEEIEKIQDLKTRIAHYRNFHDDFAKRKAKELANKIIVDKITNLMQAEEFSEKIWKNTFDPLQRAALARGLYISNLCPA